MWWYARHFSLYWLNLGLSSSSLNNLKLRCVRVNKQNYLHEQEYFWNILIMESLNSNFNCCSESSFSVWIVHINRNCNACSSVRDPRRVYTELPKSSVLWTLKEIFELPRFVVLWILNSRVKSAHRKTAPLIWSKYQNHTNEPSMLYTGLFQPISRNIVVLNKNCPK